MVIDAILSNRMTHIDAKVRSINFLHQLGLGCLEAPQAYFHVLDDSNEEVADNALFGIVFFQDQDHLSNLKAKRDTLSIASWLRGQLDLAIEAIDRRDPFIYQPYYHDTNNVWGLDARSSIDNVG